MNKMNSIKRITAAILLLSGSSLALAAAPLPTCPTAEQIRAQVQSFAYATSADGNRSVRWNVSAKPFSIENTLWGVTATFTTIYAMNTNQALDEAMSRFNVLPLTYQPAPMWDDNKHAYKCDYTPVNGNITVEAMTPPSFGFAKSI